MPDEKNLNLNILSSDKAMDVVAEGARNVFGPVSKSIGDTFGLVWDGVTAGLATWCSKKVMERDHNLELYKKELKKQIGDIPPENLQEPKMNVLGPAIEASKFYFEEKEYREMFSKLIAASFDSSKSDGIFRLMCCFARSVAIQAPSKRFRVFHSSRFSAA